VRFLRAHKRDTVLLASGPLAGAAVPAQQAALRIPQRGAPLFARMFWLALAGQIYRLSFIGDAPSFERFARAIETTSQSFRALTPEERAVFRVRRLHVFPALAGERFEDALTRGGNVERLDQIALMNALDVGDRLPAGRRVKAVVAAPYIGRR
jgi:predicted Zn-dependent protease